MDDDENNIGEVARWLPRLVVIGTLAGFVTLAWYAYRTGTQSIRDEDLMVVEADKTPMKEKPDDPGGMKFPNQDKTIFETFTNNPQPPKVERLMPAPEEPKIKELDTSETKTWINDKLYKKEEAAAEASRPEPTEPPPARESLLPKEAPTPSPIEAKRPASSNNVVSYTIDKSLALRAPTPAPAVPEPEKPAKKEVKPEPKPEPAPKAESKPAGKFKIQLGAYGAEKEAAAAFSKLQKKFPVLADRNPIIVRADLGSKGVFYRLRVGGFADAAEAKSFCGRLKGQACIPAQ